MNKIPEVRFGTKEAAKVAWRQTVDNEGDNDKDEELPTTPPDVVFMLGFDPKKP